LGTPAKGVRVKPPWVRIPHSLLIDGLSDSGTKMREICPGLKEWVTLPCGCKREGTVFPNKMSVQSAIIHLNDKIEHDGVKKEWTREEIADWLDSLDVDLTLKNDEKEN
jgi:hypothetical protein